MDVAERHQDGAERALAEIGAAQHGVFHCRQATDVGFTAAMRRSRRQNGRWEMLHRGVYRLAGTPATWHQGLMAACLAVGPGAVASHRAAGALWQLDGLAPGPIEVTFPSSGERHLQGVTIHRTRSLARADVSRREGIPVTRPSRTLLDLASVLDGVRLEAAVDAALRDGHASVPYLLRRLDEAGSQGRAGVAVLRALLDDRRGGRGHESPKEIELAALLDGGGLPRLVRQYELRDVDGLLVARFDLADPAARVAVEYESYRHHFGRQAWRQDQARHNRATALGWLVFRATEHELSGPAAVAFSQAVHRARDERRVRRAG